MHNAPKDTQQVFQMFRILLLHYFDYLCREHPHSECIFKQNWTFEYILGQWEAKGKNREYTKFNYRLAEISVTCPDVFSVSLFTGFLLNQIWHMSR